MTVSWAAAQNKISLLRFDDDFTHFKNDSLKKGFGHLKYISLKSKNYIYFEIQKSCFCQNQS
jgi:hypothetical protein